MFIPVSCIDTISTSCRPILVSGVHISGSDDHIKLKIIMRDSGKMVTVVAGEFSDLSKFTHKNRSLDGKTKAMDDIGRKTSNKESPIP